MTEPDRLRVGADPPALPEGLYDELRRLANRHMGGQRADHSLQPTALVHEAYLKLVGKDDSAGTRTHFLALASRVMRQVLVDHERMRRAGKRDARRERVTLCAAGEGSATAVDLAALHDALEELAARSPENARLIELRFFGGLTESEAATELGVSRASASRRWRFVRAWLARRVGAESGGVRE